MNQRCLAQVTLVGILTISVPRFAVAMDFVTMNFRESESTAQHLYRLICATSGSESTCTLKVVSARTNKSKMACLLNFDTLFENEPAKRADGGTYIVSLTKGGCGYTNTYVFSKTGMVQTKTSPEKIPDELKGICTTFSPKTYNIPVNSGSTDIFESVPLGDCPKVNVTIQ